MSELDDFELDEFVPVRKAPPVANEKPKAGTTNEWCSKDLSNDIPPYMNYEKKIKEAGSYTFEIDTGSDISDIIVYIERLQKSRSRLVQLEQDAEMNYSSIKLTYEVLSAYELLERPEKTQKEKEAATLVKLKLWAKAENDAKIYAGACKRFLGQVDATHHLLSKILNGKQLEVTLRGYEVKEGKTKPPSAFSQLDWEER